MEKQGCNIIALIFILAIFVGTCAFGCKKRNDKLDLLMNKLDSTSNVGYLDTTLPGWRIKSSDIKDGAITQQKDHAQLLLEIRSLRKKLAEQEKRYEAVIDLHFEQNQHYQNQIDALVEACNKKDQQIKILSEK